MRDLQRNTVSSRDQNPESFYVVSEGSGKRILFVGNSVTKHGLRPEIGWNRICGMAASDESHDYVHLCVEELKRTNPDAGFAISQVADFEREFDTFDIQSGLKKSIDYGADIVVMFFGANTPGAYIRGERDFGCGFADAYDRLRCALSAKEGAEVIHLQGFFIRGNIDAERQSVVEKYGDRFIMLGDIRTDEATHGEFNHPNDLGMKKIAECLIPALRECGLK